MTDVYEALVELGRSLGYDEAQARVFAVGRAGGEREAREQLGVLPAAAPASNRATTENAIFSALRRAGVDLEEAQRRARAAVAGTQVAESVATMDRPRTGRLVGEASGTATTVGPGRMLVRLISAGWSQNGRHYGEAVLHRDGPSAFPAGTQMHVDHATDLEEVERPAGSLRTLAGVLEAGARYDDGAGGLVAPVRLFAPWAAQLADMAEHIGVSIRAWVDGQPGRAAGRDGFVVSGIVEGRSVDFVTRAAAGGRVLSVLESMRRGGAR